jgi:hypothetical protein
MKKMEMEMEEKMRMNRMGNIIIRYSFCLINNNI